MSQADSEKYTENCFICGKKVDGYEPEMCCSGYHCGCMGLPTNPCLCSQESSDKLYSRHDTTQETLTT